MPVIRIMAPIPSPRMVGSVGTVRVTTLLPLGQLAEEIPCDTKVATPPVVVPLKPAEFVPCKSNVVPAMLVTTKTLLLIAAAREPDVPVVPLMATLSPRDRPPVLPTVTVTLALPVPLAEVIAAALRPNMSSEVQVPVPELSLPLLRS